jgi:hypothetical protein
MKNMIVGETTTKEVQTIRYKLLGQSGLRVSGRSPGTMTFGEDCGEKTFSPTFFGV